MGHLIEHAAVVFRVRLAVVMKDGDRADHVVRDSQRADQSGLQLEVGRRMPPPR